ncbi:zinc finger MYM-type protein 1-like [Abeliophyllum distichum]|uniref:Zinc finger MYM-type protein 1-like n=1 Tax=Abeliophyllum distichum TaxID=126358 RepID=A0ABD1QUX4_9LAMI
METYFEIISQIAFEQNVEAKKARIDEGKKASVEKITTGENDEENEASDEEINTADRKNDEAKKPSVEKFDDQENEESKKASIEEIDVALPTSPILRTPIMNYNVNLRNQIRIAYL